MSRQIDNKKLSKQLRIDSEIHYLLKIEATKLKTSIKKFAEDILTKFLGKKNQL